MRIFKSHPLLKLVNSYIIDSPQPSNLSYLWNFGSLLALSLVIQIFTGVTLAMHYNPSTFEAFNSVEHIMRDVNNGWLLRYIHANAASAFFFTIYIHIGRGLYYGSYKAPRTLVWTIGTIIFILIMATAFLGYGYSPKWSILNLWFFIFNFLNNIHIINLFLFLFTINFIIFYLDDFKLSSNCFIKSLQIFSFIGLVLILIITTLNICTTINVIFNINDKDINLHHVSLDKEAGKAIDKSSFTPVQKAGVIVGSALAAGLGHSVISTLNRNQVLLDNMDRSTSSDICNNISKFLNNSQSSHLQDLLFQLEAMNYVCLSLIYILILQIIFKFSIKDNITLSLSKLLGSKTNNKLEFYINKIIKLNKRMSIVYIGIILITLILGLSVSAYVCHDLYANVDNYIAVHNSLKK